MKKCIVISDSFKGSLPSRDICAIARERIPLYFPTCEVRALNVADGGEGTVDCFLDSCGGERVLVSGVQNPYGEPIDAAYALLPDGTAVVEMAAAAGLPLVAGRKNPCVTTTYGVGQLIADALARGARRIVLGLGGSATNDGGCGCAAALGVRFTDAGGRAFVPVGATLDRIAHIDASAARERLHGLRVIAMCDITNPMHGHSGAACIFAPQKGADEAARKAAGLPHRPMEEWDYAEGWVIKGDIRHFFQSIDHRRLKAALEPRFPDPDIRALMWRYIDAVDEGLALGHQTSHIYAVFYVSSFMHYVGEKLHLPLAGMYMDDWYVICPDKATAVEALRLARLEFAKLGLELNDKTNIFPLQNGIDFCGFHTYLTRTGQVVSKLRYSSIKRMKRRIRLWEKQYAAGEVSREKIMESFTAWEAHAKHGDTKQLRREMRSRLLMALDRADEARRAAGIPAARPGPDERRTKRYGTVTFQSGKRQPGEAGGKQQAHQVHQAGQ